MTFLSAYQDFVNGTLAALPNAVARLRYLGELRSGGAYQHWGMKRTYGIDAAEEAMAKAHTAVVLELLRLPMREVIRQVKQEAERQAVPASNFVELLLQQREAIQPEKLGGASARHFSATLATLSKLARKSAVASLPAA